MSPSPPASAAIMSPPAAPPAGPAAPPLVAGLPPALPGVLPLPSAPPFLAGAASPPLGAVAAGTAGLVAVPGLGGVPASGGASFSFFATSSFISSTLSWACSFSESALDPASPSNPCSQPIGELAICPSTRWTIASSAAAPSWVFAAYLSIAACGFAAAPAGAGSAMVVSFRRSCW
jgi:hypothetical protein